MRGGASPLSLRTPLLGEGKSTFTKGGWKRHDGELRDKPGMIRGRQPFNRLRVKVGIDKTRGAVGFLRDMNKKKAPLNGRAFPVI